MTDGQSSVSIFDRLIEEGSGQLATIRIRETCVSVAGGRALHGVEGSSRLLLIPLSPLEPAISDSASLVKLRERELIDKGKLRRYQSVECAAPSLERQFGLLCDEVLETLSREPADPGAACAATLERWRNLLERKASRILSRQQLLGLYAELKLLRRMASLTPPAVALTRWVGPTGARHDFVGDKVAAEVKATSSRDSFLVEIHGLSQLEAPSGRRLFLAAWQVEAVPVGGESVPALIDELVELGMPAVALFERLAELGYSDTDREAYELFRFVALRDIAFEVDDTLPRLTISQLRDRKLAESLLSVRYTLDLGAPLAAGRTDHAEELAQLLVAQ